MGEKRKLLSGRSSVCKLVSNTEHSTFKFHIPVQAIFSQLTCKSTSLKDKNGIYHAHQKQLTIFPENR